MIKIRTYKMSRRGDRGSVLSLPAVWVHDLGIQPGDQLDVYRDELDRLIIVAPGKSTETRSAGHLRRAMERTGYGGE
jgi:bifunctional DNA-binding transcriptional regulator/antitoxin component of YhaV-PrlF toxin-antitoxin module